MTEAIRAACVHMHACTCMSTGAGDLGLPSPELAISSQEPARDLAESTRAWHAVPRSLSPHIEECKAGGDGVWQRGRGSASRAVRREWA